MKAISIWLRVVLCGATTALSAAALAPMYRNDPALMGYRGFIVGVLLAPVLPLGLLWDLLSSGKAKRTAATHPSEPEEGR